MDAAATNQQATMTQIEKGQRFAADRAAKGDFGIVSDQGSGGRTSGSHRYVPPDFSRSIGSTRGVRPEPGRAADPAPGMTAASAPGLTAASAPGLTAASVAVLMVVGSASPLSSTPPGAADERALVDRTRCYFPLAADSRPGPTDDTPPTDPPAALPWEPFGDAAPPAWWAYMRVWQTHFQDPRDAAVRAFFGLPSGQAVPVRDRPGRAAPRQLAWRPGSYRQWETPHFLIYSRADETVSREIAEDLERTYWIWTQYFFPLWEGSGQVALALRGLADEDDVPAFLADRRARITTNRKLRVVLFSDTREYQETLGGDVPGVEISTGYYSDRLRLTFLDASRQDDGATRRHELVHQMFREATRSTLGRTRPGEESDFWLVEGIAGYFESLWIGPRFATLGGWDSPRLQYARHRLVVGGDRMPMDELRRDGIDEAQGRADLARWYAHAIAHTHRLADAQAGRHRPWLLGRLAELYQVRPQPEPSLDPAATASGRGDGGWVDGSSELRDFLQLRDDMLAANPPNRPVRELCLASTGVTAAGLRALGRQQHLVWLDLSHLPVGDEDIRRLAPRPGNLRQLNLEGTRVTPALTDWLASADRLRELDLSWTAVDDRVIAALPRALPLETLWLTGSRIGDDSVDWILGLPQLEAVDVQRTGIGRESLSRLRSGSRRLRVNPLTLRPE